MRDWSCLLIKLPFSIPIFHFTIGSNSKGFIKLIPFYSFKPFACVFDIAVCMDLP
jgi:hypothetical protein